MLCLMTSLILAFNSSIALAEQGAKLLSKFEQGLPLPTPKFVLFDQENLAGVYPNEEGIFKDPAFKKYKKKGLLKGSHWEALRLDDAQRAFYIWTIAPEEKGVKTFFTAVALEKAGHITPAIKAYHAVAAHFSKSVSLSQDHTFVWYVASAAISSIKRLVRDYPSLELGYVNAHFSVQNGTDTDLSNDIVSSNPGQLIKKTLAEKRASLKPAGCFSHH